MNLRKRYIELIKSNKYLMFIAIKIFRVSKRSVSGKGNKIENEGVMLNIKYDIIGNNNKIVVEQGAIVSDAKIIIRGDGHRLLFGKKTKYRGGELHFEDANNTIEFGEYTTVESAHIAVTEPNKNIRFGKDCMLSTGVSIRTGDSHSIIDLATNKRINYAQSIYIGDHVWIGANATILKGVRIENNSIISSGAIVSNDVPANCIAGGVPAKIIKTNISWDRERIYE